MGFRSAVDIVAAALGERAIELVTLRNTRAQWVAKGVARFALTVVIAIGGTGWPLWFSRFFDDPTHAFSVPLMGLA